MTHELRPVPLHPAPAPSLLPATDLEWIHALNQAVLLFEAVPHRQAASQQEGSQQEAGQQSHGRPGTVMTVRAINRAASELWNVPVGRALNRPLLEVVRRHTLEALAERGGTLELETAGKTLLCQVTRHSTGGALIIEDITEHRRREAELREATAVLSHEFRTPVTALRGVLEALQYDMPPEMAQNFVAQGLQEVERLARLVEDLAVGFRPTRARTIALAEVFERAGRLLTNEYGAARTGEDCLHFGEDHLVRADPDKLLQVVLNLVENALKYGPSHQPIEVATVRQGTWVEVAVLDCGEAIGGSENLFRAHTRGQSAEGQGSGMGLYIVRSIVQGWGGQAWAERRGERNAFCFTVPGVG